VKVLRGLLYSRVTTGESPAYPELQPARFRRDPDQVFRRALEVAREMERWRNFTVEAEARQFTCEAVSRLFGFVDDVEVQVLDEDDEAVVKVRSRSRVGRADFGANARRVKAYLAALQEALA
jgi:uncharacterized protein (DUF1499 family)